MNTWLEKAIPLYCNDLGISAWCDALCQYIGLWNGRLSHAKIFCMQDHKQEAFCVKPSYETPLTPTVHENLILKIKFCAKATINPFHIDVGVIISLMG